MNIPPEIIVGIDLGTTNSLVAHVRDGRAEVIADEKGRRLTPSAVAFHRGEVLVGHVAWERKGIDPHVLYSTKRLMGKGRADLDPSLPFDFGSSTDTLIKIRVANSEITPVEVASFILKKMKMTAERHFGRRVDKAVVTVPAYFDDAQRSATRLAGRLACLEVVRIVNEPTAAALAYGLDREKDGCIAVYDLGGGTFDISILELRGGIFEVKATAGDTRLGGDDFDRAILDRMAARLGWSELSPTEQRRLAVEAEKAKIALTDADSVEISLARDNGSPVPLRITREEFETAIAPLVQRTLAITARAVADSGMAAKAIGHVVLVGGSTRVPLVKRCVGEFFGRTPDDSLNPEEVVALGAAIQADVLAGRRSDVLLLDVVPLSLGLEVIGGLMNRLIPRNSTLPCRATEEFTTYMDGQTGMEFTVLQGERQLSVENRRLAHFTLKGIPPQPAGLPRIEVDFLVDANGLLTVSAREKKTGVQAQVEVNPSYGLTDAEVEAMLQAAMDNEDADTRKARFTQQVTEAQLIVRATEKNLELGRTTLPADAMTTVENALADLKKACEGGYGPDPVAVRARLQRLNDATQPLAELLMNRTLRELQGRDARDFEFQHGNRS